MDAAQFALYERNGPSLRVAKSESGSGGGEMVCGNGENVGTSSNSEKIMELRKLLSDQSSKKINGTKKHSGSDSSDEFELPVRRFTPLPDIPRADDAYFRTESRLGGGGGKTTKSNNGESSTTFEAP